MKVIKVDLETHVQKIFSFKIHLNMSLYIRETEWNVGKIIYGMK